MKCNNQNDRLVAVNKVLDSLNKKNLFSLREDDLLMKIELYKENCSFLQNENNKSNQIIDDLLKEANDYKIEVNSLNERIQSLSQSAKKLSQNLKEATQKLSNEKIKTNNLQSKLSSQTKQFEKLYEESQNIKYRDICTYIIDYFVCILDDNHYNVAINSDYSTAISYIVDEINTNFENYKNLLLKDAIVLSDLLNVLLKHKNGYYYITHDCEMEEEKFIRLITSFENEEMGKKFKLLFKNTPLLKKFCFNKSDEITREKIRNAILKLWAKNHDVSSYNEKFKDYNKNLINFNFFN